MAAPPPIIVRPRVITSQGERLLLEDVIALMLAESAPRLLWLVGPGGSGRTTALGAMTTRFEGVARLELRDQGDLHSPPSRDGVVVRAIRHGAALNAPPEDEPAPSRWLERLAGTTGAEVLRLAPWGTDELIEHAQRAHPEAAHGVLARLLGARDLPLLRGFPEPACAAIDAMAADPALADVRAALRAAVYRLLPERDDVMQARRGALAALLQGNTATLRALADRFPGAGLLRAWTVHVLLAADAVGAALLTDPGLAPLLRVRLPRAVIHATGALVRPWREARHALRALLAAEHRAAHATAASILVAGGDSWRPGPSGRLRLAGAHLDGARWEDAVLTGADLTAASLDRAHLDRAHLEHARLVRASLRGATLSRASARRCVLEEADLTEAVLCQAALRGSRLGGATLARARLDGCDLTEADLSHSDLRDAVLDRSCARSAYFSGAKLDGASFMGCDCRRADFGHQDLRATRLDGARLAGARMSGAVLSGMSLPGLRAAAADLRDAAMSGLWAPGATLRRAILHRAALRGACLARSDLRGAWLTELDFGPRPPIAVGAQGACEPSRPRADFTGCDLRGARLDGTDFHLVDLRDARYDADQAEYLRGCGARLGVLS